MDNVYRRYGWRVSVALLFFTLDGGSAVRANELQGTTSALWTVEQESGWQAGIRLQIGRREWSIDEESVGMDIRKVAVRGGVRLAGIAQIWGEVGGSEMEALDEQGDGGLLWGVGGALSVFEYVIRQSPVSGRQETLNVDVEGSYHEAKSSFNEGDFKWKDTRVATLFAYRIDRRSDLIWRPYEPTGYALRAGPMYRWSRGKFVNENLKEEKDFGVLLGVDVLISSGWIGRVELEQMGSSDREWSFGVLRFF